MQVKENEEGEPSDNNAGPTLVKERGKERSLGGRVLDSK